MTQIENRTRKVYLYGGMAQRFGSDPIELAAESAPSVLLALRSIFPEWRQYIRENPSIVFVLSDEGRQNPRGIEAEFIDSQFGDAAEVHILPAQEGAGLEVATLVFGSEWVAANAFAAFVINAVAGMIINMALSAVFQALAPSPSTSAGTPNQVAQKQSFLYNGAVNVQEQGGPVPVIYGYFMSGSTVVSSAVDVEQLLITPAQSVPPANGGGTTQPTSPPAVPWQWTGI